MLPRFVLVMMLAVIVLSLCSATTTQKQRNELPSRRNRHRHHNRFLKSSDTPTPATVAKNDRSTNIHTSEVPSSTPRSVSPTWDVNNLPNLLGVPLLSFVVAGTLRVGGSDKMLVSAVPNELRKALQGYTTKQMTTLYDSTSTDIVPTPSSKSSISSDHFSIVFVQYEQVIDDNSGSSRRFLQEGSKEDVVSVVYKYRGDALLEMGELSSFSDGNWKKNDKEEFDSSVQKDQVMILSNRTDLMQSIRNYPTLDGFTLFSIEMIDYILPKSPSTPASSPSAASPTIGSSPTGSSTENNIDGDSNQGVENDKDVKSQSNDSTIYSTSGWISGVVIGGVVVMAVTALFVARRRRQLASQDGSKNSNSDEEDASDDDDDFDGIENGGKRLKKKKQKEGLHSGLVIGESSSTRDITLMDTVSSLYNPYGSAGSGENYDLQNTSKGDVELCSSEDVLSRETEDDEVHNHSNVSTYSSVYHNSPYPEQTSTSKTMHSLDEVYSKPCTDDDTSSHSNSTSPALGARMRVLYEPSSEYDTGTDMDDDTNITTNIIHDSEGRILNDTVANTTDDHYYDDDDDDFESLVKQQTALMTDTSSITLLLATVANENAGDNKDVENENVWEGVVDCKSKDEKVLGARIQKEDQISSSTTTREMLMATAALAAGGNVFPTKNDTTVSHDDKKLVLDGTTIVNASTDQIKTKETSGNVLLKTNNDDASKDNVHFFDFSKLSVANSSSVYSTVFPKSRMSDLASSGLGDSNDDNDHQSVDNDGYSSHSSKTGTTLKMMPPSLLMHQPRSMTPVDYTSDHEYQFIDDNKNSKIHDSSDTNGKETSIIMTRMSPLNNKKKVNNLITPDDDTYDDKGNPSVANVQSTVQTTPTKTYTAANSFVVSEGISVKTFAMSRSNGTAAAPAADNSILGPTLLFAKSSSSLEDDDDDDGLNDAIERIIMQAASDANDVTKNMDNILPMDMAISGGNDFTDDSMIRLTSTSRFSSLYQTHVYDDEDDEEQPPRLTPGSNRSGSSGGSRHRRLGNVDSPEDEQLPQSTSISSGSCSTSPYYNNSFQEDHLADMGPCRIEKTHDDEDEQLAMLYNDDRHYQLAHDPTLKVRNTTSLQVKKQEKSTGNSSKITTHVRRRSHSVDRASSQPSDEIWTKDDQDLVGFTTELENIKVLNSHNEAGTITKRRYSYDSSAMSINLPKGSNVKTNEGDMDPQVIESGDDDRGRGRGKSSLLEKIAARRRERSLSKGRNTNITGELVPGQFDNIERSHNLSSQGEGRPRSRSFRSRRRFNSKEGVVKLNNEGNPSNDKDEDVKVNSANKDDAVSRSKQLIPPRQSFQTFPKVTSDVRHSIISSTNETDSNVGDRPSGYSSDDAGSAPATRPVRTPPLSSSPNLGKHMTMSPFVAVFNKKNKKAMQN